MCATTLTSGGFLILPETFTGEEVDQINARMPQLFSQKHEANIVERGANVVRTAMGLHLRDSFFGQLVRDPRLALPALQILQEEIYLQQIKVNVKAAFSGEVWQWHYDYATHKEEDGVEQPLALNLHIFLDDVSEFNGPLYFIPGSHRLGEHGASLDDQTTSYPLWVCDQQRVTDLVAQSDIVSATGKKGTMLIFHDTLVHGSPNNMSPWDRAIFSIVVNPISNAYTKPTRPDYKHHRDLTPIKPLSNY